MGDILKALNNLKKNNTSNATSTSEKAPGSHIKVKEQPKVNKQHIPYFYPPFPTTQQQHETKAFEYYKKFNLKCI